MVSKRGGRQTSYEVGRSSTSSGVSTQSLHSDVSSYIQQTVPGSPDEVQSPSLPPNSPHTYPTVGTSKNVRRNSRSLGLDRMRGPNKIHIEICKITGNPVGLHSNFFSSEVGIVTRLFAAPDALKWRHVPAETKATLFKFLREKFKFSKKTYAIVGVLAMMKDRYKSYQYKLRQQFRDHPTMELALEDVPDKISKVAWGSMCEAWAAPDYMDKCKISKENRSKLCVPHTSGSKSFQKVQYEQVKLKARDDEAIADGTGPLTAEELSIDVFGYKSGSIRGLGRGAKPSSSSTGKKCRVQLERELETTRRELDEQRGVNQQLVDRVKSLESNSMQINSKLDFLMQQMARGQPANNSFE